MFQTVTSRICLIVMAAVMVVPTMSGQQLPAITAAPLPAQIVAARKVFISNAGTDVAAQATFKRGGEPDQAYNHFYSAIQTWGRYEIVATPGEADLVLELSFTAPTYYDGNVAIYEPQFGLRILDAKTHFLLWSLNEPVEGAFRKATWVKNFDQGLRALMDDLKKLSLPAGVDPSKK
jgi:hypothetical protein